MSTPIKRIEALKSLSRDHHHALLLCWKIREGIKRDIEITRIKTYVDWFWENHLKEHFEVEECVVFPILGKDHVLVKQAKAEHRRLKKFFEDKSDPLRSISLIEEELEKHVRFEERVLFNEIQKVATPSQILTIASAHSETKFQEEHTDEFWTR